MQSQNARLLVIEFGASWPRWLSPTAADHMVVVAQHYEGPPESLIAQVTNRLSRLVMTGWRIEDAVLVSNGRTDDDALWARSVLARGLLRHLREVGGSRLVLYVAKELGERARHTLTTLSQTLQENARGAAIGLGVRIGDDSPEFVGQDLPSWARAG
jgi:hypothetical protein